MSISVMHPNDIERSMFPQQYPHSHSHPHPQQRQQQNNNATGGDEIGPGVGEATPSSNASNNLFNLSSTSAGATVPQASMDRYISSMGNLDPRPIAAPTMSQNQQKVQPRDLQSIVGIGGNINVNANGISSAIGNHLNHTNDINVSMYQQGLGSSSFQPAAAASATTRNLPNDTMMAAMLMMNNSSMNNNTNNGFLGPNPAGLNHTTAGKTTNVSTNRSLKNSSSATAAAQSPSSSSGVAAGLLHLQGVTSNGMSDGHSVALAPSTVPSSATIGGRRISATATTARARASSQPNRGRVRTTKGASVSNLDFDEATAPVPVPPSKEGQLYFDDHDVLSGRGGGTNVHPGNRNFRDMINKNRRTYLKARKNDKPAISRAIVRTVRERGGKFLKKDEKSGLWFEVGDDAAREKTSQALRQRAPEMRRLLFENEQNDKPVDDDELRKQRILAMGGGGSSGGRQNSLPTSINYSGLSNDAYNNVVGSTTARNVNLSSLPPMGIQLPSDASSSLTFSNDQLGQSVGLYSVGVPSNNVSTPTATGTVIAANSNHGMPSINPALLNAMKQQNQHQQLQEQHESGTVPNNSNLTPQQQLLLLQQQHQDLLAMLQQQRGI